MDPSQRHGLEGLLSHVRWVEALAQQLVRDPAAAEDLAQSTLLIALRAPAQPRAAPRAWLARVLRNRLRETHRREAQRPAVERSGARSERLPAADELVARAEAERRLVETVLALEPEHSQLLLWHYFEGLPLSEIARLEGLAPRAVSERLARAHARLRERLAGDAKGGWLALVAPIVLRPSSASPFPTGPTGKVILMSTAAKVGSVALLAAALVAILYGVRSREQELPELREAPAVLGGANAPSAEGALSATQAGERASAQAPPAVAPPALAVAEAPKSEASATGRLFGRVFGPDGQPAAGRAVRILRTPRGPSKNVTTDAEGRFDERELAPAHYHLSTQADDKELAALGMQSRASGLEWLAQTSIDLEAGAAIEVDLGAPPKNPIRVRGRLLTRAEPPQTILQWIPEGEDGYNRAKYASARDDGSYEIVLADPGRYRISCILQANGPRVDETVEVPSAPEWSHDIALPSGRLALRATLADGTPVKHATVGLTPRAGLAPYPFMSCSPFSRSTDDQGRQRFEFLRPGTYALGIHGAMVGKEQRLAAELRTIVIEESAAEPEELVIVLAPGISVSGKVVADDQGEVKSTDVFVFDENGEPLNALFGASADKQGIFKLPGLRPGRYGLVGACGDRWSDPVELVIAADQEPSAPELHLRRAARLIVDAAGLEAAWIDVRDARGRCLSALLDRNLYTGGFGRACRTSSASYYLPSGNYEVRARGAKETLAVKRVPLSSGETLTCRLAGR